MPPGPLLDGGIRAPEFQITTELRITSTTNRLYDCTFDGYYGGTVHHDRGLLILSSEQALAADPVALVEDLNLLLMSGSMSTEMKTIVESMVTDTDPADSRQRVLEALYLITTSPEYAVQK
jgi:hypothetical protein